MDFKETGGTDYNYATYHTKNVVSMTYSIPFTTTAYYDYCSLEKKKEKISAKKKLKINHRNFLEKTRKVWKEKNAKTKNPQILRKNFQT